MKISLKELKQIISEAISVDKDKFLIKQRINIAVIQALVDSLKNQNIDFSGREEELIDLLPAEIHSGIAKLASDAAENVKLIAIKASKE